MAADQFLVLGKGYVAFDNASAHTSRCFVRLLGVLGELQGSAAVADRKIRTTEV
jgi:hypothetical protein